MRKLFERIVDFMEENGSIQSEYRDVYLFALQTVAVYAFNIGTGVVIGAAFGELLYCMIFLIAFMLLRQEAGGYHAPGWMRLTGNRWGRFSYWCGNTLCI